MRCIWRLQAAGAAVGRVGGWANLPPDPSARVYGLPGGQQPPDTSVIDVMEKVPLKAD